MHRDERHRITFHFLVLGALGVQCHLLHEFDEAILRLRRAARSRVQCSDELADVLHAILRRLGIFLRFAQVIQITRFRQEAIRPIAQ